MITASGPAISYTAILHRQRRHMNHARINRIVINSLIVLFWIGVGQPLSAQKGAASPAQGASAPGGQAGGGSTPYFETVMLAHGAVNELAEGVAQRVCNAAPRVIPPGATIVIFDQQSFQNLGLWQSFATGAEMLADAYRTLPSPAVPAAPAAEFNSLSASAPSASFIQGGADLGSLISAIAASTSNTASTFTIPDSTMAVSLMHQFERINCDAHLVYYPIFGSYTEEDSATDSVRRALQNLNDARKTAQANWIGAANTTLAYSALNDLNTQYDMLLKDFLTMPGQSVGGGGGPSASSPGTSQNTGNANAPSNNNSAGAASLLQGAELEELIKKDNTYILYADVVAAGGTQRDIKNVFTLITGDWLSYSGGVVVNVALIKSKETKLEFSDTLRYRTDFHHKDLWDELGFKSFSTPSQSRLVERVNTGSNASTLCNHGRSRQLNPAGICPVQQDTLSPITRAFLTFDRTDVTGGSPLTGTVTLSANTPASLNVRLFSSDASVAVGGLITIPANSNSQTFTLPTLPVLGRTEVVVSAVDTAGTLHNELVYLNARLLSLSADTVPGGTMVIGTVVLPHGAPKDGTRIDLFSSNPTVTLSDASIVIGEDNTLGVFRIFTSAVPNQTRVVISASYDDVVQGTVLTIN